MSTAPELTLKNVRRRATDAKSSGYNPNAPERHVRVRDLLSSDEITEVKLDRQRRKQAERIEFDAIDVFVAELIARFGYDFYRAWKDPDNTDITTEKAIRFLYAERLRDLEPLYDIASTVAMAAAGAQQPTKNKRVNKGMRGLSKKLKQFEKLLDKRSKV